jgi:hypothetical protein
MNRLFEENCKNSQHLVTNQQCLYRFTSQDSLLISTLSEDCFTTILNILLNQTKNTNYNPNILDIYVYILKFVCKELHHICHKKMSHYYATIKYQTQQRKIDPFGMLQWVLFRKECNLAYWIIDLEKFPKILDETYDLSNIWKLAAYSGNINILEWFNNRYTTIECLDFAMIGAVKGNQIDVLNWSLDNRQDENHNLFIKASFLSDIFRAIKYNNIKFLERLMTRVEVDESCEHSSGEIKIKTKIGKNDNSFLYIHTSTNIFDLFFCAVKYNRVNVLGWFSCRGLLDLPFWGRKEKENCVQTIISQFNKSPKFLNLLNNFL